MATTPDHPSERSHERQRVDKGKLPRLAPEHYRARSFVHWTLTLDQRATGWLTPAFHHAWQLTLLHACARYGLACPASVLMPDHSHLLLIGLHDDSDQRTAIEFLRKHLRPNLAPHDWQHQTHDHVLRDTEREQGAFQTIAHYILENPVRAGLCLNPSDYAYIGCCVPGYPELNIHANDYWLRFWRLHNYLVSKI
jgi:putative transposase